MAEVITLDAAKAHLRVVGDDDDDDVDIASAIVDAQGAIEDYTGLALTPRTLTFAFDRFATALPIRVWPITSVNSITYLDATGTVQTVATGAYRVAMVKRPARLVAIGRWPRAPMGADAVTVEVSAGYADASEIPPAVIRATKLMIGHFFENREAVIAGDRAVAVELPLTVEMLLRRHRYRTL